MQNVLVIDDELDVRDAIERVLTRAGYSVRTAGDASDALAERRRSQADVVITDIIMPEQEGIETIMRMKRERPEVKIIAISGGGRIGNVDVLTAAKSLGADHIIAKPFEAEELLIRLGHPNPLDPSAGL